MSFLLDTDTCSAYMKGHQAVFGRMLQYSGGLHVSTISLGELYSWVFRKRTSPKRLEALSELLDDVTLLDVTSEVAKRFGEVRAYLLDQGLPAPDMDLLNAAIALVYDLTLVTHNVQDYTNVPHLRILDWTTG